MGNRVGLEVSIAVAEAVKLCNVDVIAAYPITPQTHIVEHLAELVANGELDAEFVSVESEHAALSCCVGASAAGARAYTSTAAQGFVLMSEIVYIASAMRLPIVMNVANRSLSGPISIWNDHSDIMAHRDCGWIQMFAENGQEAVDLTIQAFKIAENRKVLLPVIVNFDGFICSHMIEPIDLPTQEEVDKYLPPYKPLYKLDPKKPISIGPVGIPEVYTEAKMAQNEALKASKKVIIDEWKKFGDMFGRYYNPVETYKVEDAKIIFVTIGSISETAMTAIDAMRDRGEQVGLVRIRLWRPFPIQEFKKAIGKAKILAVLDRAISPGGVNGPVACEIKSLLYRVPGAPKIFNFIVGLGGRDVTKERLNEILDKVKFYDKKKPTENYEFIGVREI